MTEIDFDELDRAVNSLVGPAVKSASPIAVTSEPDSASTPSLSNVSPLAERRSSGRFMDVVHPSSDMRSGSVPPRPVQIQPLTTTSSTMPDPIDVQPLQPDENSVQEPLLTEALKETDTPLGSPFLTDAKVEKRPLGAFSDNNQSEPVEAPIVMSDPEPATDVSPVEEIVSETEPPTDQSVDGDTPMPAELQPGLLSIEANENLKAEQAQEVEPVGPTSITQQYSPQPSTGDKPVATMFDTAAYKKPQSHSGKKKSGWLVVLWIFLLLVVGAGIGAAVYFFVLPRL